MSNECTATKSVTYTDIGLLTFGNQRLLTVSSIQVVLHCYSILDYSDDDY